MNKECPYCHVDGFGLMDLFELDYFHPSLCPNCKKLVRNSGWSQFLGPATTLLLLIGVLLLTGWLPEWLIFSLIIFLGPLPMLLFARPVKTPVTEQAPPPFTRDPNNDKLIVVSGWSEQELRKILADFSAEDVSSLGCEIEIQKRFENEFRLTFPKDVSALDFAALVNYLNYPIDFDPGDRSIVVAGKTTLTADFEGIPKSLLGKKAVLYVPENDEEYTTVYLHAEDGNNFANFMQEPAWQRVTEARFGNKAKLLIQ